MDGPVIAIAQRAICVAECVLYRPGALRNVFSVGHALYREHVSCRACPHASLSMLQGSASALMDGKATTVPSRSSRQSATGSSQVQYEPARPGERTTCFDNL